jgi:hypothetical protein
MIATRESHPVQPAGGGADMVIPRGEAQPCVAINDGNRIGIAGAGLRKGGAEIHGFLLSVSGAA